MRRALTVLIVLLWVSIAGAADLQWDYPSDWTDIIGYTVYFNEVGQTDTPHNKTVLTTDPELIEDGTAVTYLDIDDKLNLQFDQPYNFYITAYNDGGESGPSNIISYTRSAYNPPVDSLPAPVVSSPQSSGGLKINP